jgi:predicted DCC family thiol-disulfide oxidoreductase YuxK
MKHADDKLEVFYDGGCIVCRQEMERYSRRDKKGLLTLVDISLPTFDPAQFDRDLKTFMAKLHVRDAAGEYYTGVDAFTKIWAVLPEPELHLLAAVVALPGVSLLARSSYWLFAHSRKFLPKAAGKCDDESCHVGHG